MGTVGVFYSLAAYVAIVAVLRRPGELVRVRHTRIVALGLALAVMSSGWVVRAVGLHYQMNLMTFYDRNEWVYVDDWLLNQRSAPTSEAGRVLVKTLRDDALEHAPGNPYLLSP